MLVLCGVRRSFFFYNLYLQFMTDKLLRLDGSFICYNCDAKALASPEKIHEGAHDYHTHTLVRCQKLVKDAAVSVEERLASLEAKFAGHEEIMNDRLLKLEKLLEVMHEKLAVEAS